MSAPEHKSRNVTRSLMRGYRKSQREAEAAEKLDENLDARLLAAKLLTLTTKGSVTLGEASDRLLVTTASLGPVVRRLVDAGLLRVSDDDLQNDSTVVSAGEEAGD